MSKSRAELEEALRFFDSILPALADVTDPLADVTIARAAEELLAQAGPPRL